MSRLQILDTAEIDDEGYLVGDDHWVSHFIHMHGWGLQTLTTVVRDDACAQAVEAIRGGRSGSASVSHLPEGGAGDAVRTKLLADGWIHPLDFIVQFDLPPDRFFGVFDTLPLTAVSRPKSIPRERSRFYVALVKPDLEGMIAAGQWGLFVAPFHQQQKRSLRILESRELRSLVAAQCMANGLSGTRLTVADYVAAIRGA